MYTHNSLKVRKYGYSYYSQKMETQLKIMSLKSSVLINLYFGICLHCGSKPSP